MASMLEELEQMMIECEELTEGLDDRSEELEERCEEDEQIRFYRAMASIDIEYRLLLDQLAQTTAEMLADTCLVHLIADGEETVELAAAYHPNPIALESLRRAYARFMQPVGCGIVGKVIAENKPYYRSHWSIEEMRQDINPDLFNLVSSLGLHSVIVVPLATTDGQVLGTLTVARHSTRRSYGGRDLALTQWIAAHAAMKVETARLYSDLQATNEDLDAALTSRDAFMAMAAHELRTPLTSLMLHAQLLLHQQPGSAEAASGTEDWTYRVEGIIVQVDRLARLITQLVDVTRLRGGELALELEAFDLAVRASEVVDRFALELERAGSSVTLEIDGPMTGHWDRERLDQILTNLIANAIKYGAGKPIVIQLRGGESKTVIRVCDKGTGIAAEDLERIFERFVRGRMTRHISGLGLGLWIVKGLVDLHQGTIAVQSAPGEGSCFQVELPSRREPGGK